MGGDDSQKLRPWRGMTLLSGAQKYPAHCKGSQGLSATGAIDEVLPAVQILDFAADLTRLFSKTDPRSPEQQRKRDQRSRGFLKSRVPRRVYSQPLCDFNCRAAPPARDHAGKQQ